MSDVSNATKQLGNSNESGANKMYYSYKKASDKYTVYRMLFPYAEDDTAQPFELGTIDGITYVAVPDGMVLPRQPKQIADSIKQVVPDQGIIDKLAYSCPVIALTKRRMAGLEVKTRLSKQDELTLGLITGVVPPVLTEKATYLTLPDFVLECRTWDKTAIKPEEEIITK